MNSLDSPELRNALERDMKNHHVKVKTENTFKDYVLRYLRSIDEKLSMIDSRINSFDENDKD